MVGRKTNNSVDKHQIDSKEEQESSKEEQESSKESKFLTPKKQSTQPQEFTSPVGEAMLAAEFNKLAITPEKYQEKTFSEGKAVGKNKGKIKLDNRKNQNKQDNRNAPIKYPVIVQKSPEEYEIEKSSRGSGNDELFQAKKLGTWKELDKNFGLETNDEEPTFFEIFNKSRVKTKELHSFDSGHTGAMYDSVNGPHKTSQVTAGYFKESKSKNRRTWDPDKNQVIKKVTDAAENEQQKKESPRKATAELLKLAVEKTVGYRQNTEENKGKFKNFTSAGLNLSDDVEREFALKTSQSARDKWKMSTVALEGRWNDKDSDEGEYSDTNQKSVIKRKVGRTKVDPEIHGGESRSSSPVRSGTPYSDFNFDYNFNQLQAASQRTGKDNFLAIADVFSQPTPPIKPSPEFKGMINDAITKNLKPQKKERMPIKKLSFNDDDSRVSDSDDVGNDSDSEENSPSPSPSRPKGSGKLKEVSKQK